MAAALLILFKDVFIVSYLGTFSTVVIKEQTMEYYGDEDSGQAVKQDK